MFRGRRRDKAIAGQRRHAWPSSGALAWVRYARTAAALGLILFGSASASAQAPPSSNQNRTVNLNYVYAAELGFGGYSLNGLTAQVYEVPLNHTFHDVLEEGWAIKVLAPIQVGLYSLDVTDTDGERISFHQQSLAFVPGAELQIPVGSNTVVKPFGQFGVGHAFGTDVSSPNAYVYMAGVRTLTQWQVSSTTVSLGTAAIYAGDSATSSSFSEHYVTLQSGLEVRHALDFRAGTLAPDIGLYAIYYYYPEPLVFSRFLDSELKITQQGEIGFSVGSETEFRLMGMSNPRIGVGYIFGGGLNVLHVNFGFQF